MKKKILSAARIAMVLVACILGMSTAIAQNRAISGVVVDQAGVPVIGASVIVVGNSSNGTITDIDGHFSMTVPAGASVTVSSLGYKSIVASIGDQSEYRFVLQEDTESIEETVVIGYGVQKKSDLTGSVASVRSDDLKTVRLQTLPPPFRERLPVSRSSTTPVLLVKVHRSVCVVCHPTLIRLMLLDRSLSWMVSGLTTSSTSILP